jgi:hypothetical protein
MKLGKLAIGLAAAGGLAATGVPAQTSGTSTNDTSTTTPSKKASRKRVRKSHRSDAQTAIGQDSRNPTQPPGAQSGLPSGEPGQSGLSPDRKTTDAQGNTRVVGTDAMNSTGQVKVMNDNDSPQGTSAGVGGPAIQPGTNPSVGRSGNGGPGQQDSGAKPRK